MAQNANITFICNFIVFNNVTLFRESFSIFGNIESAIVKIDRNTGIVIS